VSVVARMLLTQSAPGAPHWLPSWS
jgi:hypothetical protein